jgi:hypothetical protein
VIVWVAPLIWLVVAGGSIWYPGGEHMALAIAMMPALLVRAVTGIPTETSHLALLVTGFPIVATMGFLLDWARISLKTFFVSFAIGVVLAYGLILFFFAGEVNQSGFNRAYNRFDFDQPDRRVAWQLLCTLLGLYVSLPVAVVAQAIQALRKK